MKKLYTLFAMICLMGLHPLFAQPLKLWTSIYKPGGNGYDYVNARAVVLSTGDMVYAETYSQMVPAGTQFTQMYVNKHSAATGASTYRANLSNTSITPDYVQFDNVAAITKDAADNVYIAGKYYYNASYNHDAVLIKLNSSMVPQYTLYSFSASPISGNDYSLNMYYKNNKLYWLTYRQDVGSVLSVYTDAGTYVGQVILGTGFTAADVRVNAAGEMYVIGSTYTAAAGTQVTLLKYDTSFGLVWLKNYNAQTGANADLLDGFEMNNNGDILFTEHGYRTATGYDGVLVKYNAAGTKVFSKFFNGSANSDDLGGPLTVDASDNIYATFATTDFVGAGAGKNIMIKKFTTTGTLLKTAYYRGSGNANDVPSGIKIGPNGRIYVTGLSTTATTNKGVFAQYDTDLLLEFTDIVNYTFNTSPIYTSHAIAATGLIMDAANYKAYWLGTLNDYASVRLDDNSQLITIDFDLPTVPRLADPSELTRETVSVYPNPATTGFTIHAAEDISAVEVFSTDGKLVVNQQNHEDNEELILSIEDWKSGLYLVTIHLADGTVHHEKILKAE